MKFVSKTDIGRVRTENQDRVWVGYIKDDVIMAIVCDGMGGEKAGGVASEMTMDIFRDRMKNGFRDDIDGNSLRNLMITSIEAANTLVYEKADNPNMQGMGTTCVAVVIQGQRAYIINVGDSRAYCISRDGGINQITKDHTMVRMLVEQGKISEDEVQEHPQRNYITRAVGAREDISADYFEIDISGSDKILLCSDGLSGYLDEEKILEIVSRNDINAASDALVNEANERGGYDNITVVLISNEKNGSDLNG
ncbi:MAG: Stp1/IreP family PP2C-type Ser/Thr phosphatase [Clostridiales bacterium]|nr:Stp1/IreP family PP2C-type Ser/Thr phosphatase [Clostridiales bacterium]